MADIASADGSAPFEPPILASFSSHPGACGFHAVFAYGLLTLLVRHVAAVALHRMVGKVDLLPRILRMGPEWLAVLRRLPVVLVAVAVSAFAVRRVTTGPLGQPRENISTAPFAA